MKEGSVVYFYFFQFWIFPNLTEDVGFFESFWPVYVYTYTKPKKVTPNFPSLALTMVAILAIVF
jgi:hypothetical protein